jgi:uncharacterized protein YbjT (DUF2867 family)
VARRLLEKGFRVRGITRNIESDAAKELTSLGAEMVRAEFTDPDSLGAALVDVDAVFAMTTPFEAGIDAETAQGVALVDAAVAAGVGHFVYSSVASANKATGVPHFDSKYRVEEHLVATDLRGSVIAPVYFMGNLFFPDTLNGLKEGTYTIALPSDLPLQQIATEDIGAFAAHVLANPEEFSGKRIDIAGDELSSEKSAEVLADIVGKPLSVVEVPIEAIRSFSEDFALMYEWFASTGYSADVEGLRSSYPEVGWTRFEEWAARVPAALA